MLASVTRAGPMTPEVLDAAVREVVEVLALALARPLLQRPLHGRRRCGRWRALGLRGRRRDRSGSRCRRDRNVDRRQGAARCSAAAAPGSSAFAQSPSTTKEPIPRSKVAISEQGIPEGRRSMQPKNPLHGITLETIVTELVEHYGWPSSVSRSTIRCFTHDPSIASSLKFLRRTPGRARRSRASTCSCCANAPSGTYLMR